jgi:2-keto-4-pentenoate hydratase/2-oxohepta-3-ene-1,7-dioic acid hydratase in catechol pathway
VAVIGQRFRRVNSDTALASVAGYTVGTDVSVRDCRECRSSCLECYRLKDTGIDTLPSVRSGNTAQ